MTVEKSTFRIQWHLCDWSVLVMSIHSWIWVLGFEWRKGCCSTYWHLSRAVC